MRSTRWARAARLIAPVLALLFVVGGLPGVAPRAVADEGPGLHEVPFTHDNLARRYFIYEPASLATPTRVVFALHGGTQYADKAATQENLNGAAYRWRQLADAEGFLVVYPEAVESGRNPAPNWNDCRNDASRLPNGVDDVGFIDAILGRLTTEHGYDVDAQHVYAVGASNGGMMAQRLALELSHKLAAVGAIAANLPAEPKPACPSAPANPISIVFMNGNGDKMMPWDGGCVNNDLQPCDYDGTVLSSDDTVTAWRAFFGANTAGPVVQFPDDPTNDRSRAEYQIWSGGTQGVIVGYYKALKNAGCGALCKGAGHATSAKSCCQITAGVELIVGKQNRDYDGIDEIWRQIKTHSLSS